MTYLPRRWRIPGIAVSTMVVLALLLGGGAAAMQPGSHPSPVETMPSARYGHTMVMSGDAVYLFGGNTSRGPSNELWRYNPAAMGESWEPVSPTGSPPPARFYQAATTWQRKMIILHGTSGGSTVLNDIWQYDPTSNAWTQLPSSGDAPEARYLHSATAYNDKIYLFGGWNAMSLANDNMYNYNPATGVWQRGAAIGTPCGPRYGHGAAPTSFGVLIGGGFGAMNPVPGFWTYLTGTDTWAPTSTSGSTFPSSGLSGTASQGNRVWTFGGEGPGGVEIANVTQIECSSSTSCMVTALRPLSSPRADSRAVVLPGATTPHILVFGGRRDSPPIPIAEPLIYEVGAPPATTTPTRTRTGTATVAPTNTGTATRTATPSRTATSSPRLSPTRTATPSRIGTATATPTVTRTPSITPTPVASIYLPIILSRYITARPDAGGVD